MRKHSVLLIFAAILASTGCGGGSSGGNSIALPAPNVQPIVVDSGPVGVNYVNGLFTSVQVCVPGTSNCQTIDHVLVDTGSFGLRVVSSELRIALPQENDSGGNPLVECNQFLDGFTWGPVQLATIKIASEEADSIPIQVIGSPGFPNIPAACSNTGPSEDTVQDLGANGILGIGPFREDCGSACVVSTSPGLYYSCPSSGCQLVSASLSMQVQNPVWHFATDNNGVVIEVPDVSPSGALTVNGSLVFGIGTQSNNALKDATVLALNSQGNFSTLFNGQTITSSFIDSGSNGLYFLDASATGMPDCNNAQFYCPALSQSFSARMQGGAGSTLTVSFAVANTNTLFATPNRAFDNLAGPNPGGFDWGMSFFYGRRIFTAIEAQNTPAGAGPYFAF